MDSAGKPTTRRMPVGLTHEKGGVVGGFCGGGHDRGVGAARAAQFFGNICGRRVQGCRGAEGFGVREFFIGDVNRGDGRAQARADLHGDLAQAADAEDRQTLAWLDFGVLESAIHGDACAEKRRGIARRKLLGNFQRMTRGSFDEFREAAVHGDAGDLLFDAEILIALAAELTFAAAPVQPGDADAIADLQIFD